MSFTDDDVIRVCAEVSRFGRKAGYTFKGLPVVQWEFPTIGDFARAKVELLRALSPMMVGALGAGAWQRETDESTFEIDCHAVTFRLVCRQVLAVPGGRTVGAAEIVYTSQDDYEARQRRK